MIATRLIPLRVRGALTAGLRGAAGVTQDAPALMLQNEEATVVLRVKQEARHDAVSVRGLVMPHRGDSAALWGAEAHLLGLAASGVPSGGAYTERVDERGGFVLEGVAPGTYRLELRWAGGVVVTEDLELGRGQGPRSRHRS